MRLDLRTEKQRTNVELRIGDEPKRMPDNELCFKSADRELLPMINEYVCTKPVWGKYVFIFKHLRDNTFNYWGADNLCEYTTSTSDGYIPNMMIN